MVTVHEPPCGSLLGHSVALWADPLSFYIKHATRGTMLRLTARRSLAHPFREPFRWYFIWHPAHLKHVLFDNHKSYTKGALNKPFQRMLGLGLLTSEGDVWRRQRRFLQPAFTEERAKQLPSATRDAVDRMFTRWRERGAPDLARTELSREIAILTMDIVCSTLLSVELSVQNLEQLWKDLHLALEYVTACSFALVPVPSGIPTLRARRFSRAMERIDGFVHELLEQRQRERPADRSSETVISRLVHGIEREAAQPIERQQARDEVITILHAGQNTLASAVCWTLIFLSRNPAEMRKAITEAQNGVNGASADPDRSFIGAALREAMRLYPPAWGGVRETLAEDRLDDVTIPPGIPIVFSQFVTQRHPALWDKPLQYLPERFVDGPSDAIQFSYLPFGVGPHRCIGEHFALWVGCEIIRRILDRWDVEIDPRWPESYRLLLDLEPRGPVHARLHQRK